MESKTQKGLGKVILREPMKTEIAFSWHGRCASDFCPSESTYDFTIAQCCEQFA